MVDNNSATAPPDSATGSESRDSPRPAAVLAPLSARVDDEAERQSERATALRGFADVLKTANRCDRQTAVEFCLSPSYAVRTKLGRAAP